MSDVVETLIEMGFSREQAQTAIAKTHSNDIATLTEWLITHGDEVPVVEEQQQQQPDENVSVNAEGESASMPESTENTEAIAKSIKCDECGKLFNNQTEIEFHSVKSGHTSFSESVEEKKPLSEDERKEQLTKIEEKLKLRRMEREEREKQEALEREKKRIRSGKDMLEAKRKQEDMEIKKIVEQRKREKEEDRMARQRVKDQIEQDRLARKAKFDGAPSPPSSTNLVTTTTKVVEPTTNLQQQQQQQYTSVKLQIRLTNGKTLTQSFGAKEPLSAVRVYIEMNRDDGPGPFSLMTSFPRKEFNGEDYEKPLESLGLAPSSVLIVKKLA